jgi:hypothetical protein
MAVSLEARMTDISPSLPGTDANTKPSTDSKFLMCNGVKPETIREILHEAGYQAIVEDIEGGCHITSASNGTRFYINLYAFDEGLKSYKRITISTSYTSDMNLDLSVPLMNRLNAQYSFIKGYVEDDGSISMQMDWLVGKGVSVAQLTQWISMWKAALILFEDYWAEYENNKS